jgi:DNA-binding FadR family transcriptional regulator
MGRDNPRADRWLFCQMPENGYGNVMVANRLKVRIPGKIAAEIGGKITSGRLKPGALLEGEIEASGERKVSRSAYREAVRILVAKGLVQSRPKVGTRVTETSQWQLLDPDVLSWIFAREPPHKLLVSLFELRKFVEPEAAALAAQRRTLDQLKRMGAALEVMAYETLHTARGRAADQDFHAILLAASANPFLVSLSSSVTAAVTWSTMFKERTQRLRRDAVPDHIKIYEAIAARDPRAAKAAMAELIDLAFSDATQRRQKAASRRRR